MKSKYWDVNSELWGKKYHKDVNSELWGKKGKNIEM